MKGMRKGRKHAAILLSAMLVLSNFPISFQAAKAEENVLTKKFDF
ncbi:hypothetical protein [Metabacillus sp. B2-18]|nr:hypothetical protein [Metabacillus sp. B2-18]